MPKEEVSATNPQWEKLQAMRRASDDAAPKPPAVEVKPDAAPAAPAVAAVPEVPAVPPVAEQPRNADGTFKKPEVAPAPPAPDAAPVAAKPAAAPVVEAPITEEIDIDGQKVHVDPAVASAFKKAAELKKQAAQVNERTALVNDVADAVTARLTPPVDTAPPAKTAAEIAAEKALEDAKKLKMPDSTLLVSDPGEYNRQMELYIDQERKAAKNDAVAEIRRDQATTSEVTRKQQEEYARGQLREQFYTAYPVFRESEELVNVLLNDKFDEVIKSGRLKKELTRAEADALKVAEFADVATRATRKIVKVMAAGKKVMPPAAPPPALVSSAPAAQAKLKVETPPEVKEKYPKGSVSRLLADRKASKEAAA